MKVDTDKLITALRYEGTRHLYMGDLFADSAEALESFGDRNQIAEEFKDTLFAEMASQFPAEDFLVEVISEIQNIKKLKKSEMIESLTHVCEMLEDIQQTQLYATEYGKSVLKGLE